jgi:hypothetical protein
MNFKKFYTKTTLNSEVHVPETNGIHLLSQIELIWYNNSWVHSRQNQSVLRPVSKSVSNTRCKHFLSELPEMVLKSSFKFDHTRFQLVFKRNAFCGVWNILLWLTLHEFQLQVAHCGQQHPHCTCRYCHFLTRCGQLLNKYAEFILMRSVSLPLTTVFGSQWRHVERKYVGLLVVMYSEDGIVGALVP